MQRKSPIRGPRWSTLRHQLSTCGLNGPSPIQNDCEEQPVGFTFGFHLLCLGQGTYFSTNTHPIVRNYLPNHTLTFPKCTEETPPEFVPSHSFSHHPLSGCNSPPIHSQSKAGGAEFSDRIIFRPRVHLSLKLSMEPVEEGSAGEPGAPSCKWFLLHSPVFHTGQIGSFLCLASSDNDGTEFVSNRVFFFSCSVRTAGYGGAVERFTGAINALWLNTLRYCNRPAAGDWCYPSTWFEPAQICTHPRLCVLGASNNVIIRNCVSDVKRVFKKWSRELIFEWTCIYIVFKHCHPFKQIICYFPCFMKSLFSAW